MPVHFRSTYLVASSTIPYFSQAIAECCQSLKEEWQLKYSATSADQPAGPDLVLCFFSGYSPEGLASGVRALNEAFPQAQVAGCGAAGILANDREFSDEPSVVVWCAYWGQTEIDVFHLQYQRTSEGAAFGGFPSRLDLWGDSSPTITPTLLALGDPYTFPMDVFLDRWNEEHPGCRVVGGMASHAAAPGETCLICQDQLVNHGAVFVWLPPDINVHTVISQGCRPIGKPLVITKSERNQIEELGGKPAVEQLTKIYRELPTKEQAVLQTGLHIGLALNEYQESFRYGDFLIRNVLQVDSESQTIVVGEYVRIGQTIQFHIRDADSAALDLRQTLEMSRKDNQPHQPAAALLFSCNGRTAQMFGEEGHDPRGVRSGLGAIPLAGFYAAGEIGYLAGKNHMHGFTASIVWFGD